MKQRECQPGANEDLPTSREICCMNLSDFDLSDPVEGAAAETLFICPGSTSGITRSVHLARLHSGWPVCDQCEFRRHTEGLSEQAVGEIHRVRELRRDGLERSEFGVRGPWMNVLDRGLAERLAEVFCLCLQRAGKSVGEPAAAAAGTEVELRRESLRAIVIGYDCRSFSQDLFAGVTEAVSRLGFPVFDAGRTTAAALHEAVRRTSGVLGGVWVTGAGCAPAWAGLDVFDSTGEAIPVVWKDFGIRLYQAAEIAFDGSPGPGQSVGRLRLDVAGLPETGRRLSRSSGVISWLNVEDSYRRWLSAWYTGTADRSLVIVSDDPLIRQRVEWLNDQRAASLVFRDRQSSEASVASIQVQTADDDRFFVIQDAEGRVYPADLLAQRLNRLLGSEFGQLTVHADAVTGRIWLTDAVLPTAGSGRVTSVERIEDSLAFAGLLLRLKVGGRLLA